VVLKSPCGVGPLVEHAGRKQHSYTGALASPP
jgi:hypothetical protein